MLAAMVMIIERGKGFRTSYEPRGLTMAQALAHFGQRQADLAEALHRV